MIELEKASFMYEGAEAAALQGVSLRVRPGECVVLTGASGCGKTTVTRLVNGLIPHFYAGEVSGRVLVAGKPVADAQPHELSPLVGSVFQNPRTQFFNTDTTSELVFGMENAGLPHNEMHARYGDTVRDLQLEALTGRDIFALSGGEKQRIAFGGVYAMSPLAYALDEPTANLDAQAVAHLRDALLHVKSQGRAILLAEHQLAYLRGVADRIVLMKDGRIAGEWPAEDFAALSDNALADLGLRSFRESPIPALGDYRAPTTTAIEIRGLCARYGDREVLSGFEFGAGKSEIVGITGANGKGKTTLARTICGLHRESGGQILFSGKALPPKKRSRHAYLVMQDPNYQLFSDSVGGELRLNAMGKPPPEKLEHVLQRLELEAYRERHPLSLSGGQKQRLAIALAALSPADILLFDEPTSGLDYGNMRRVTQMLEWLAERGKTILVISHDRELLTMGCHRVVGLEQCQAANQKNEEVHYANQRAKKGQKA